MISYFNIYHYFVIFFIRSFIVLLSFCEILLDFLCFSQRVNPFYHKSSN